MTARPAKKQRHAFVSTVLGTRGLAGNVAFRLMKAVENSGDANFSSTNAFKKCTTRVVNEIIDKHCVEVEAPLGNTLCKLRFVQPVPVLESMCQANSKFADLLSAALTKTAGRLSLVVYHDEITPGNVLKTDNHLKTTALYFSLLELGPSCLQKELCWIPAGLILHNSAQNLSGGLSAWVRYFVTTLLPNLEGAAPVTFKAGRVLPALFSIRMFLFDEAAMKATADSKGASGTKPCSLKCKNVISKHKKSSSAADNDYLVSIAETSVAKFDPMEDEDVWSVVDHLSAQSHSLGKRELEQLETRLGMNNNPFGILQDTKLRKHVKPTDFCYDPGHVYFSNGVVGWEIGLFVGSLKAVFPSITDKLLEYMSDDRWRTPLSHTLNLTANSRRNLVSVKLIKEDYKGSASQCMSLLPFLACFAAEVVAGTGKCRAETESMLALHAVCRELARMKHSLEPLRDASTLRGLQQRYLDRFVAAYGDEHVKPKHHFQFHIADQIERHGIVLDTVVCERKHSAFKTGAAPFLKKIGAFEKSALARLLAIQLKELGAATLADTLIGATSCPSPVEKQMLGADDAQIASSLSYKGLTVTVGDVVVFEKECAAARVGCCLQCNGELEVLLVNMQLAHRFHLGMVVVTGRRACL